MVRELNLPDDVELRVAGEVGADTGGVAVRLGGRRGADGGRRTTGAADTEPIASRHAERVVGPRPQRDDGRPDVGVDDGAFVPDGARCRRRRRPVVLGRVV